MTNRLADHPRANCFVGVRATMPGANNDDYALANVIPDVIALLGVDWSTIDELHVTFCYLDWTSARVRKAVDQVLLDSPYPPPLQLTGEMRVFGDDPRRRLVALIEPTPALITCRAELARALRQHGIQTQDNFCPHLTVARISPWVGADMTSYQLPAMTVPTGPWQLLRGHSTIVPV